MRYRKQTPKKWKFLLLIGRPLACIGLLMVAYALVDAPERDAVGGLGILLVAAGFIAAWTGKIGAFWFHG